MNNCKKLLYGLLLYSFISQSIVCSDKNDLHGYARLVQESMLENLSRRFVNGENGIEIYGNRLTGTGPALRAPVFFVFINKEQKNNLLLKKKERDLQKAAEDKRK